MRWMIFVLAIGLAGCGGDEPEAAATTPRAGADATFRSGPEREVVYVDVRTPDEFAEGHVEGALNIPVEELGQRWTELEQHRDKRILVYCRSGRRSARALSLLEEHGFQRLENAGAFSDLRESGVPTTGD